METVLVLADSRGSFDFWCAENGINPLSGTQNGARYSVPRRRYVYAETLKAVSGLRLREVVVLSRFWGRDDADEIWGRVQSSLVL